MLEVHKQSYVPDLDYASDVMGVEGSLDSVKVRTMQKIKINNKVYESEVKSFTPAIRWNHRGLIKLYIPKLKKELHISFGSAGDWAFFKETKKSQKKNSVTGNKS